MNQQTAIGYSKVNRDIIRMLDKPTSKWWALFLFDLAVLGIGLMCFIYQVYTGLGVTGYSHPVFWAVYITNFVFWVGIAHSGTLISAILFLF